MIGEKKQKQEKMVMDNDEDDNNDHDENDHDENNADAMKLQKDTDGADCLLTLGLQK